jgi:hypothetical protein
MVQNALNTNVTGGNFSTLNIQGATVVKGAPGRLAKLCISNAGSAGNLVINDSATLAGANSGNIILTMPYNAALDASGSVINLDWPCLNGIVISAMPTGSIASVSWT